MLRIFLWILSVLFYLHQTSAFGTDSIILNLLPLQTKCFKENILPKTLVRGEVVLLQGANNLLVDFKIASSTNAILHTRHDINHDKWSFKTPKQRDKYSTSEFKFCLTGRAGYDGAAKGGKVRLTIGIGATKHMVTYEEAHGVASPGGKGGKSKLLASLARTSDVKVIEKSIERMDELVGEVIDELDVLRSHEDSLTELSASLTKHIVFFSFIACAALFAAGFTQTTFVASYIEERLKGSSHRMA